VISVYHEACNVIATHWGREIHCRFVQNPSGFPYLIAHSTPFLKWAILGRDAVKMNSCFAELGPDPNLGPALRADPAFQKLCEEKQR
jgi:hypothetical protein